MARVVLLLGLLAIATAERTATAADPVREPSGANSFTVHPDRVEFTDLYSGRQLRVVAGAKNSETDVTRSVRYISSNPKVVEVDSQGFAVPRGVGKAELMIESGDAKRSVAVVVAHAASPRGIDFGTEIVPLLGRFGCNAGGCHGKANGQNGFKLSLFGFDTEFDYQSIVLDNRGRRVTAAAPEKSLLLQKGAGEVPHGGGKRIEPGSDAYRLLQQWVVAGLPASDAAAPRLERLVVEPSEQVFAPGTGRQLQVFAAYHDGSRRDVTRHAEYQSNLGPVASVDHNGYIATGDQSGEAAIMIRYMGRVAVFRALVPQGKSLDKLAGFSAVNEIDRLAMARWKRLGIQPSPVANDATYLRRVTLDLNGRIPTVDETKAFLADTSADKRAKLVDKLLAAPDYSAFFAMRWGAILRNSRLAGADQATYAFHNWLKDLLSKNRPYDELVRGVVAAAGEWQDAPAINWYWQMRDDQLHQVTADTAQVFLGVRLQCARCHHHPYERWSQEDYYGLAGFFTRLGRKGFGQPPPYFASPSVTTGEKNPLTNKTPEPKFPDGEYGKFTPDEDPRHALVDWMARPDNPFFAKVLVNRLWGHMLGQGLVNEVDDLRETNPASNPELLDWLAKDFVASKFDMQRVLRQIANSRVYQLTAEPTPENEKDRQNFARYYARRLYAEVFLDAVDVATGSRTTFSGVSAQARAVDLPHEGFGSYFLDTFDRPKRVSGCECERSSGATLSQVLLLANSSEIENKIADGKGRIASLMKRKAPPREIVDELYLAAYSRLPTDRERAAVEKHVSHESVQKDDASQQRGWEDVLWSLINSREFLFNH